MKPINFNLKNKIYFNFLIIFILILFNVVHCDDGNGIISDSGNVETTKKIGLLIIHEKYQKDIRGILGEIFRNLEEQFQNEFIIQDRYITLDRDAPSTATLIENQYCSALTDGISFVLDVLWSNYEDLAVKVENSGIPYIKMDISVYPFVRVMEQYLLARSAIDNVFILQSEREADEALYGLITDQTLLRILVLNQMNADNVNRVRNLRPVPSYFSIIASTENMNRIFGNAVEGKVVKRPEVWNVLFLDRNHDQFQYHETFKDISQLVIENSFCCRWLQQSDNCECPSDFNHVPFFLREILTISVTLLKSNNYPLLSGDCNAVSEGINILDVELEKQFMSRLQNNVLIYHVANYNPVIEIRFNVNATIYSTETPHTNEEVISVGRFLKNSIVSSNGQKIKSAKRFFRIGTTEAIPWTFYKRDPDTNKLILDENGSPIWDGYCVDFIKRLSEKLNFDYEIVKPKMGSFGKKLANGKWDGVVGDLMTGETDIAVAALKMTAEREEVIDFIAPYYEQTGISIVIRKPVRQTSLFKFMTVLRLEVWLSIVAALIATAILIWFLDRFSPYSARNNKAAYPYPCREFTLKESFWFALTSFTPQGGGEAPKALSGRILVAAYWLFVVLMLATFTANLAAFLTVERMQTPVQSLEQLARQSRINYTVVESSDTHKFFINMKFAEDTLYRAWKEITLNSTNDQAQYRVWEYPIKEQYGQMLLAINTSIPVRDAAEGFRKVNEHENADFAFIHDSSEIKYEISRSCNLTEVGEVFAEQPYAVAVQQGSQLQDELSKSILELQKERFFEGLTAKYWNYSAKSYCDNSDDSEGITLESLGGVFIATLFGLALAMVTLVGEVLYYKKKDTRKKMLMEKQKQIGTMVQVKNAFQDAPPAFDKNQTQVTMGSQFIPAAEKQPRVAYVSVYPRKSIRQLGDYIE